jgi:DNA-binding response OmpR family regulator
MCRSPGRVFCVSRKPETPASPSVSDESIDCARLSVVNTTLYVKVVVGMPENHFLHPARKITGDFMPLKKSKEHPADHHLPELFHALVLLIDDQAHVAGLVRMALAHQKDIDFHYCSDPREAIGVANHFKPTVILLDLVMPQMSGLELLKKFRENPATKETPIIVLSAEEEARTKGKAFSLGANDYLVKLPSAIEIRARLRYHSRAYLNGIQREEAFKALRKSQQQMVRKNTELSKANQDLDAALAKVKQLHGLLPICSSCKKIRDENNTWSEIESYIQKRSNALFTHSICPECMKTLYPEMKD